MKNAQPRFGLHDDGRLHDYVTGRTVDPAVGSITDVDGVWDLPLVVTLITEGKPIEAAFSPAGLLAKEAELHKTKKKLQWAQSQIPVPAPPVDDKVAEANKDFIAGTPGNAADDKVDQANKDFEATGEPQ